TPTNFASGAGIGSSPPTRPRREPSHDEPSGLDPFDIVQRRGRQAGTRSIPGRRWGRTAGPRADATGVPTRPPVMGPSGRPGEHRRPPAPGGANRRLAPSIPRGSSEDPTGLPPAPRTPAAVIDGVPASGGIAG